MIYVVPFRPEHLELMDVGTEPTFGGKPSVSVLKYMAKDHAFTVMRDGEPIACGGTLTNWAGNYMAWAYMTAASGPHMLQISRLVKQGLAGLKGRIAMTTPLRFKQGIRWAKLLGFEVETPVLKHWGIDGADHVGFVRIQE